MLKEIFSCKNAQIKRISYPPTPQMEKNGVFGMDTLSLCHCS